MKQAITAASCGPYEILAPSADTLFERDDGTVEVQAERSYVVRFGQDASRKALARALSVRMGANEGTLRFKNFVGISQLGPRRLHVCSDRLDEGAVAGMLDDVCHQLASLPFYVDTPTGVGYSRIPNPGPEVLYHSFAFLRDCLRTGQPHDLSAALQHVLAGPYLSLQRDDPARIPLVAVGELDAEALISAQTEPDLLEAVSDGSPLSSHPLATSFGGAMPSHLRTRRARHSADNKVNRFVVGALETMIDWLRRFERLVQAEKHVASALLAREAAEMAADLERSRRHPALQGLSPVFDPPLQSTVLRGRAGYRNLLATYTQLLQHASRAEPHAAQPLLELRDAAAIYELWCFFQIAEAISTINGIPDEVDSFAVEPMHSRVPRGYSLRWKDASLVYNQTFGPAGADGEWPGTTSYSRQMRPDVALRSPSSGLHLFDAKLKLKPAKGEGPDAFESEDIQKMHAYRDALNANSVWVLSPGGEEERYPVPVGGSEQPRGFRGIGAIPLRPGVEQAPLRKLVSELLAT